MAPENSAVKRLLREYHALQTDDLPFLKVKPDMSNLYDLEDDTPYSKGVYYGRLDFPKDYPFGAPQIQMLTPNGRFRCNTALCFSMSNYHPESWNPSWRIATILIGFLSFMLDPANPETTGSILSTEKEKKRLAIESFAFNANNVVFKRLFPEFCDETKFKPGEGFTFNETNSSSSRTIEFSSGEKFELIKSRRKSVSQLTATKSSGGASTMIEEACSATVFPLSGVAPETTSSAGLLQHVNVRTAELNSRVARRRKKERSFYFIFTSVVLVSALLIYYLNQIITKA